LKLIWDVGGHEVDVDRVTAFTNNVQIELDASHEGRSTTDQGSMIVGVFFDNRAAEDRLDHVAALEAFFESVSHCMTSDRVVACSHTLPDVFDVH